MRIGGCKNIVRIYAMLSTLFPIPIHASKIKTLSNDDVAPFQRRIQILPQPRALAIGPQHGPSPITPLPKIGRYMQPIILLPSPSRRKVAIVRHVARKR